VVINDYGAMETGSEQRKTAQSLYGEVPSQELDEIEGKEQNCVEIINWFTASENLNAEMDVNRAVGTSHNIKTGPLLEI
jgi:hypothetical protein